MTIYTGDYQQKLLRAWSNFIHDVPMDYSPIREEILSSWKRSKSYGIDPYNIIKTILGKTEIKKRLEAKKELIEVAQSYMKNLYSIVKGSSFYLLLSDEEGYIIDLIGDKDIINKGKENSLLVVGANRSEQYAGTNAIGTCLELKKPIQIWGEEHYVKPHQYFTCSAAPIYDKTGKILGCLDISGPRDKVHLHTLGMVVAAVDGIEQQLKMKTAYEEISIINSQLHGTIESIASGIFVFDNYGTVIQVNNYVLNLFKLHKSEVINKNISNILSINDNNFPLINADKNIYDQEVMITSNNIPPSKFNLSATLVYNNEGERRGTVMILKEIKYIHKLTNKVSGFKARYTFDSIIGNSPEMKEVIKYGGIAAKSSSNILILGESGTGKEIIAQSIHNASNRANHPFIAINCGALPKGLIGSELFGYEGGTFTGARKEGQAGKFELADGGTIFLDEIGDMPLDLQVNLLRVLQTKEIVRIGGKYPKKIDVRIISATNVDLEKAVENRSFRSDLYYRLNVFYIHVPPLRERKNDIKILTDYFLDTFYKLEKKVLSINKAVYAQLSNYTWPGNVRELENVIERAVNICEGDTITIDHLPQNLQAYKHSAEPIEDTLKTNLAYSALSSSENLTIQDSEYKTITSALSKTNGNVKKAAEFLGIGRRTLYRKLEKYSIDILSYR